MNGSCVTNIANSGIIIYRFVDCTLKAWNLFWKIYLFSGLGGVAFSYEKLETTFHHLFHIQLPYKLFLLIVFQTTLHDNFVQ